jgi:ketosteroid isomerase-like protein
MGEEIRGRAALREFYRQVFESAAPRLSDYTFECRFLADAVFVRESWRVTMNLPGQEPKNHTGRSLWVGRKAADGVWRTFWSLARLEA